MMKTTGTGLGYSYGELDGSGFGKGYDYYEFGRSYFLGRGCGYGCGYGVLNGNGYGNNYGAGKDGGGGRPTTENPHCTCLTINDDPLFLVCQQVMLS